MVENEGKELKKEIQKIEPRVDEEVTRMGVKVAGSGGKRRKGNGEMKEIQRVEVGDEKWTRWKGYAGSDRAWITISQARLIFRSEPHVEYYSNPLEHSRDMEFLDSDELPLDNFEFLLSICYASLPIRVGSDMWIEPYCPNRFAR
ncbi:hypothetical protein ACH5RR_023769 [Cinchona calisaya]|uniref:Uncharacterized protein n=1 Tax=Cinchona calisaya TaxID=153742 RepID=A0ABD2ZBK4_9GENT